MKKSLFIAIPVLALLMGSAHAVLNLDNLPNLSAEDRKLLALAERSSQFYQKERYMDYIKRADADPDTVARLLIEARGFVEESRATIYAAYMGYTGADLVTVAELLDEARGFQRDSNKAVLHEAYMGYTDADPDTVDALLAEARRSQSGFYKAVLYAAYMGYADADPVIVAGLLDEARGFQDEFHKLTFYNAYMGYKGANPATVAGLLDEARDFQDEFFKANIYKAYLINPVVHDADTPAKIRAEMKESRAGRYVLEELEKEHQEQKKNLRKQSMQEKHGKMLSSRSIG